MGYEPIGRIRPVGPSPSLLTSARPFPDVNWSTGVSWLTSCMDTFSWPHCSGIDPFAVAEVRLQGEQQVGFVQGETTHKALQRDSDIVHTMPFTVYTPMRCSLPINEDDVDASVSDATEAHTCFQIADALWMGSIYDTADLEQPTLRRSAQIAGDDVLDLDDGVASLLTHYNLCTQGQGGAVIHLPSALIPYALGGGSGGARLCWPEGNLYRGPLGAVFSPGPGYPEGSSAEGPNGHGPLLDPGPPETYAGNEAGTSWIYVTGPVEYATTDVVMLPNQGRDRVQIRTNIYEAWGERFAIVRFDPCCVFAVEVTNPAPLPEVS